jgi:hypothetical protein
MPIGGSDPSTLFNSRFRQLSSEQSKGTHKDGSKNKT